MAPEVGRKKRFQAEIILAQPESEAGNATLTIGKSKWSLKINAHQQRGHLIEVDIPAGEFDLHAQIAINGRELGPHQVVLKVVE